MAYSKVRRLPRPGHRGLGRLPQPVGFAAGLASGLLLIAVGACSSQSVANKADTDYTDQQYAIYNRDQSNDLFDYSQDRASFQAIYRARVAGKATWSASVPTVGGHPWYECPSRGYPIPATSQLTNPERTTPAYSGSSLWFTVPQGEPNGLYSGPTDGTYMQCVDTDGSMYPVYSEPPVLAWPFPVVWKGDHFEKANPADKASFELPPAPPTAAARSFVPAITPGAATPGTP